MLLILGLLFLEGIINYSFYVAVKAGTSLSIKVYSWNVYSACVALKNGGLLIAFSKLENLCFALFAFLLLYFSSSIFYYVSWWSRYCVFKYDYKSLIFALFYRILSII